MFETGLHNAALAYRSLRRRKYRRETKDVLVEYSASWNWFHEALSNSRTVNDWLCIDGVCNAEDWRNIDGKMVRARKDTNDFYRRVILDAILRNFPQATSITEFGCGVGRNVLYMKLKMPAAQIYGYELCQDGVDVARAAAAKFDIDVQYERLDYLSMKAGGELFPATDVAFTCFSLEQLPKGIDVALANILGRCKMGSVHLEPVPENYPLSFRGLLGRFDHWKIAYLRGFDAATKRTSIRVTEKTVFTTAHNPLMFPSLYVLKKSA